MDRYDTQQEQGSLHTFTAFKPPAQIRIKSQALAENGQACTTYESTQQQPCGALVACKSASNGRDQRAPLQANKNLARQWLSWPEAGSYNETKKATTCHFLKSLWPSGISRSCILSGSAPTAR